MKFPIILRNNEISVLGLKFQCFNPIRSARLARLQREAERALAGRGPSLARARSRAHNQPAAATFTAQLRAARSRSRPRSQPAACRPPSVAPRPRPRHGLTPTTRSRAHSRACSSASHRSPRSWQAALAALGAAAAATQPWIGASQQHICHTPSR